MQQTQLERTDSRCYGFCCAVKDRCLRYTDRENCDESAIVGSHLCDPDEEGFSEFVHAQKEVGK